MLAILVALGCSGVLAQVPSLRPQSTLAARGGAPGQRLREASHRALDLGSFQLSSLGVRPRARGWNLTWSEGTIGGGAPAIGPAMRPVCTIQVLQGDASLDLGMVGTAPQDVDARIQRPSGCAQ
jgi:hypothetical protein